jgi:hypothetical protein
MRRSAWSLSSADNWSSRAPNKLDSSLLIAITLVWSAKSGNNDLPRLYVPLWKLDFDSP